MPRQVSADTITKITLAVYSQEEELRNARVAAETVAVSENYPPSVQRRAWTVVHALDSLAVEIFTTDKDY